MLPQGFCFWLLLWVPALAYKQTNKQTLSSPSRFRSGFITVTESQVRYKNLILFFYIWISRFPGTDNLKRLLLSFLFVCFFFFCVFLAHWGKIGYYKCVDLFLVFLFCFKWYVSAFWQVAILFGASVALYCTLKSGSIIFLTPPPRLLLCRFFWNYIWILGFK